MMLLPTSLPSLPKNGLDDGAGAGDYGIQVLLRGALQQVIGQPLLQPQQFVYKHAAISTLRYYLVNCLHQATNRLPVRAGRGCSPPTPAATTDAAAAAAADTVGRAAAQ